MARQIIRIIKNVRLNRIMDDQNELLSIQKQIRQVHP